MNRVPSTPAAGTLMHDRPNRTLEEDMLATLKRFWHEESGQGLVEYALILFLIAIVVIVALTTLGKKTNNVLTNVGKALNA